MNEKQTNTPTQAISEKPDHGEAEANLKSGEREAKEIKTARIRTMNDVFRQTFIGGSVMLTQGIQHMPDTDIETIITQVRQFNDFTEENDPHGEHDFGIIKHNGESVYWKIDYFNKAMDGGSEDPSDPKLTRRVLTIMRASEY